MRVQSDLNAGARRQGMSCRSVPARISGGRGHAVCKAKSEPKAGLSIQSVMKYGVRLRDSNKGSPDDSVHVVDRRGFMATVGGLAGGCLIESGPVGAEEAAGGAEKLAEAPLMKRALMADEMINPGASAMFSRPGQIYFPRWLFGQWGVTGQLASFRMPLGSRFVDPSLAVAFAASGDVNYTLRFFSTLPDTFENQMRVILGSLPEDAIIQDRAYNVGQVLDTLAGTAVTGSVQFDPFESPDRASVALKGTLPFMGLLRPSALEMSMTNLKTEDSSGELGEAFTTSELIRLAIPGAGSTVAKEFELLNVYTLQGKGRVALRQRVVLYADPDSSLSREARGRAVAVLDLDLRLKRDPVPSDAPHGAMACVATPKDAIQCL